MKIRGCQNIKLQRFHRDGFRAMVLPELKRVTTNSAVPPRFEILGRQWKDGWDAKNWRSFAACPHRGRSVQGSFNLLL